MRTLHYLLPALLLLGLAACSGVETERHVPKGYDDERKERIGKLTGEGLILSGRSKGEEGAGALGVNSYLWRATLDTVSFMPLASADPFGGVIITDWYEDPKAPGERFKVNALILDKTLRADGVKVSIFKQKLEKGVWRDQPVDEKLQRSLEDTILTRARQLRVAQLGK